MIDKITTAQRAHLFGAESDEQDAAAQGLAIPSQRFSQLQHAGNAGGVIVRAVVHSHGIRPSGMGARTAQAEMIIVRADDEKFVFQQRIVSGQLRHHVGGPGLLQNHLGGGTERVIE
ncbi:MAG: hypothetical protein BWY83_01604 [bacterium ADurb.Bin478]|nr:MAG: hypothetical protein BWY83_01604 [bacterium ADurb.Bin478]